MAVEQLGVLTVGTLVSKEGGQTLSPITLLAISSRSKEPPLIWLPEGHHIRAYPMQHLVNRAHTHWYPQASERRAQPRQR